MNFFRSKIWKTWFKKGETKCIMLGLDGAGKSTILEKLNLQKSIIISPTIGFFHDIIKKNEFTLTVWDSLNWPKIPQIWEIFFSCHGMIFVIDASDLNIINDSIQIFHKLIENEKLRDTIILVLVNKKDISGSLSKEQIIDLFEMKKIEFQQWNVQCVSAITGEGLFEAFWWLGEQIDKKFHE